MLKEKIHDSIHSLLELLLKEQTEGVYDGFPAFLLSAAPPLPWGESRPAHRRCRGRVSPPQEALEHLSYRGPQPCKWPALTSRVCARKLTLAWYRNMNVVYYEELDGT